MLLATLALTGLAACGSDDDKDASGSAPASAAEKAFLAGMVAHHQAALDMTKIAADRAKDPFISDLAAAISSTQTREISQMEKIYTRLLGGKLEPDPSAHDGLGLTAQEAGMTHSPDTTEMLQTVDPFDRAFVDEMVPHHVGAVRMSRVLLKDTKDGELRTLAEEIVATQEREIKAMNDFRTKRFGGPAPARAKGAGGEHGGGHSG